jgi:HSP20 family protein
MADEPNIGKATATEIPPAESTRAGYYFRPNVDILERADELTVLADVPGAAADGVDIRFEDGMLSIHAKVPPRNPDVNLLVREYGVGDFFREFRVNETIDTSKITADLKDGVLVLHLPKVEAVKPRKISVKS